MLTRAYSCSKLVTLPEQLLDLQMNEFPWNESFDSLGVLMYLFDLKPSITCLNLLLRCSDIFGQFQAPEEAVLGGPLMGEWLCSWCILTFWCLLFILGILSTFSVGFFFFLQSVCFSFLMCSLILVESVLH